MIHVMFVCLGNICRSPLAEGVFKKLIIERNLQNEIAVDSAGTSNWHVGDLPDPRTEEIASQHDVQLDHRGQQIHPEDLQTFDYIVAMDISNYNNIRALEGFGENGQGRLIMMRDFDELGKGKDVPDPYYGGANGFENVYKMLLRSCTNFLDYIVKEHNIM